MKKLDPRLRHAIRQSTERAAEGAVPITLGASEMADRIGVASADAGPDIVEVLVRCTGERATVLNQLSAAGMRVRFDTQGAQIVVSGEATLETLERLSTLSFVERVESSRPMVAELDISRQETRAAAIHRAAIPVRGAGAIVGVIDGGIDYTHPHFRRADGSSRILLLWDQGAPPAPGGTVPYGREYTKADLDRALASSNPRAIVPHEDAVDGHGTHVAGIAAGGDLNGAFSGIAPDADLLVVALKTEAGRTLGRSVRAFDAFTYIVGRANGRPVAINLSQGMNGGGHSGETVLETGLDNLARQPNVAIIKSAGNEQTWRIHAGGRVMGGQTLSLELVVQPNNREEDVVEVWYDGSDAISIAVQPPGEAPLAFVAPGGQQEFVTAAGNQVSIDVDTDADDTGDTRATIIVSTGSVGAIQAGTWRLQLRGDSLRIGRYDAWIERARRDLPGEQTQFSGNSADETRTISIPGTARRVITVGAYVTRPGAGFGGISSVGQLSAFSSRGPSRYGLQKPEIAAPGERIISARSSNSVRLPEPDQRHTGQSGTSMAAPHVTGAAALILSVRPNLTCEQVKEILVKTARHDGQAASAPDNSWGSGKLDVAAAVEQARTARFPRISNVRVNGATLSWETDIPTTGAVRFHTHQRKLKLGSILGRLEDGTPRTEHSLTLADLDSGAYACEILAVSEAGWSTTDDNAGSLYLAQVAASEDRRAPEDDLRLVIGGLNLEVRPDPQTDQPPAAAWLRAQVSFGLTGDILRRATLDQLPYFVQILAYQPATGETTVVAVSQGQLRVERSDYTESVNFALRDAGRYQTLGMVILPDRKVGDVALGPVVHAALPEGAASEDALLVALDSA
jgi:subtilisin family serine protease